MIDETDTTETGTLAGMSLRSRELLGRMTAAERLTGRFMRAPEHDDGGDPPVDPPADPDPADPPSDPPADPDPADPPADPEAEPSLMDPKAKEEPDPATLPPEKYELTAPEGFTIDETVMAEADPIFREIGLTNEQADKLMPLAGKFAERIAAQQNDAFQAMKTDWAKASKADKEIGGANWKETESLVAKALDTFGAPEGSEFRKLLNETGLGNHPEMIRIFRKIGAETGEGGGLARGDTGAPTKSDRLSALYPEDLPKQEVS